MRIATGCDPRLSPLAVAVRAAEAEALGYDAIHLAETVHDPMAAALLVGEATSSITVRTAVVVAFVRSPTLLAYQALDAQAACAGRFELGIGSQVRQVVEGRYAMAWGDPVGRLRDHVEALRSLMAAFAAGEPAAFSSEHVVVDRVPAYFNPGPLEGVEAPPVLVGAVRSKMATMAGGHADGVISHPTGSDEASIRELLAPCVAAGARAAGRDPGTVRLIASPNVVTGPTTESLAPELARQRQLLAFLLTTPAYAGVLERLGVPELAGRLRAHLREEGEPGLAALLPEEVLDAIVPAAPLDELPGLLAERYAGLVDELVVAIPPQTPADQARSLLEELKDIPPAS